MAQFGLRTGSANEGDGYLVAVENRFAEKAEKGARILLPDALKLSQ